MPINTIVELSVLIFAKNYAFFPQSLVSGGVDSAVCTALLNAALGPEKVIAVHIDNGFMRKNESQHVKRSLEALGLKPHGEPREL